MSSIRRIFIFRRGWLGLNNRLNQEEEWREYFVWMFSGQNSVTISLLQHTHFWKFMPNSTQSICPICGGETHEIRAKLHCRRCGMILETCCEGGPMHARSCDQQTTVSVPSKNSKESEADWVFDSKKWHMNSYLFTNLIVHAASTTVSETWGISYVS